MIRFRSVTMKNFKSFGNAPTTFEFHEGELARIRGVNGQGKSTIMEALFFCLYNKAMDDVNKDDLVNSINSKGLEVGVEFLKGDTNYRIERGVKPNYLRLFINDEEQEKSATVRDDQKIVEEVLEMNANTFRNTVVMSQDASKFFMDMTPAERREIVEELLNIRQFSVMSEILRKEWTSTIKADLKEVEIKIGAQGGVVASAIENLERVKVLAESEQEKKDKRKGELGADLNFATEKKSETAQTIAELTESINELPTADALETAKTETGTKLQEQANLVAKVEQEIGSDVIRMAELQRDEIHVKEKEIILSKNVITAKTEMTSATADVVTATEVLDGRVDTDYIDERIEQIDAEVDVVRSQNIVYWETKIAEANRFNGLIAEGKCPTCQREACADSFEFTSVEECQKNLKAFQEKILSLREERGKIQEEKDEIKTAQISFDRVTDILAGKSELLVSAEQAFKDFKDMAAVSVSSDEIEQSIKRLTETKDATIEQQDKYQARLDKVMEMVRKLSDDTGALEMAEIAMRQVEGLIETTEKKIGDLDNEPLIDLGGEEDRLNDVKKVMVDLKTEVEEYNHTLEYYSLIKDILSDDGIKSHIVNVYIPYLNEKINHYLVELDAYYDFHFTPTFDVEIKSRFRDKFKFGSFSSGQKSRINIAIMLAFVDLAGAKSTIITNLMFLDELLDSHLDDQGCDDILRVLRRLASDEQKAINIISHKSFIVEGFNREFLVSIEDNFTTLKEVH